MTKANDARPIAASGRTRTRLGQIELGTREVLDALSKRIAAKPTPPRPLESLTSEEMQRRIDELEGNDPEQPRGMGGRVELLVDAETMRELASSLLRKGDAQSAAGASALAETYQRAFDEGYEDLESFYAGFPPPGPSPLRPVEGEIDGQTRRPSRQAGTFSSIRRPEPGEADDTDE